MGESDLTARAPLPVGTDRPADEARARPAFIQPEILTALVVLFCTAVLLLAMRLVDPTFGSVSQLTAILVTSIFLVVASFGQGLTILLGGIDLSIGVVMSIGAMMIAGLTNGSNAHVVWALPAALLACAGIGVVNGLGVALGKIPPFIMTLSTATIFFGIALGLTSGSSQFPVAPAVQAMMSGHWLGIPLPILLIVAFVVVAVVLQNGTAEGRKLYAIGSSPGAARVIGLPIIPATVAVYGISGLCAGYAGILLAGYSSSAILTMGDSFLMPTIAAVVIGGARVTGGKGIYLGTFAGALFLSTLETIITVLGLSQALRDIIQGGVIIAALLVQSRRTAA